MATKGTFRLKKNARKMKYGHFAAVGLKADFSVFSAKIVIFLGAISREPFGIFMFSLQLFLPTNSHNIQVAHINEKKIRFHAQKMVRVEKCPLLPAFFCQFRAITTERLEI